MSNKEKTDTIEELSEEISKILNLSNAPNIEYYEGNVSDCGCYDAHDNSIWINRNNFDDPQEIVDTIAHEMRHADRKSVV